MVVYESGEGDAWSVVGDVVCGRDEGVNGAWQGKGEERSKPSSLVLGEPPG